MIPAVACVMFPVACNSTVPLDPEPVLTAWFNVRAPAVDSVMSPVFDTTPVTAPTQPSASAATSPIVSGVTAESSTTIMPEAVSCAASVEKLFPTFSRSILPDDVTTTNVLAVIAPAAPAA